jgi:hypothetical protein
MISYRKILCFSYIYFKLITKYGQLSLFHFSFVAVSKARWNSTKKSSFMTSAFTYLIPFLQPFHVFISIPPLSVKTVN